MTPLMQAAIAVPVILFGFIVLIAGISGAIEHKINRPIRAIASYPIVTCVFCTKMIHLGTDHNTGLNQFHYHPHLRLVANEPGRYACSIECDTLYNQKVKARKRALV